MDQKGIKIYCFCLLVGWMAGFTSSKFLKACFILSLADDTVGFYTSRFKLGLNSLCCTGIFATWEKLIFKRIKNFRP